MMANRWPLGVSGQAKAISHPPGLKLKGIDGGPHKRRNMWFNSMIREELKLKGIDGGPHKRRNMWFNSMIREEPYPGSNGSWIWQRCHSLRTAVEVLHGCRQLVP